MTVAFDIRADVKQVRAMFKELGPGVDRAASRAINRCLTPVRNIAARKVKQKRNLPSAVIKSAFKVSKSNYRYLQASVEASGKSIPIRHFVTGKSTKWIKVRIEQKGKSVTLRQRGIKAFINDNSKLGPNVFVRTGKSRLPVTKWPPVPGIPKVFVQRQVVSAMQEQAATTWTNRFPHELKREIEKVNAKATAK